MILPEPLPHLGDTNILLYSVQPAHPLHPIARGAVDALLAASATLFVTPQVIAEFWNVATRPEVNRGLGLTPDQAFDLIDGLRNEFGLLLDEPAIYEEWLDLVRSHRVQGVQVHDARLVAAMRVHGLTRILTFNGRDFTRYPGIEVIDPRDLVGP